MSQRHETILANVLLAVGYVAVARAGLSIEPVSGFATLVWPPTGLALSMLLLGGRRLAIGVAVGAFVANVWTGAPVLVALGIATGNTLEALVAVVVLRRVGFQRELSRVRDVVALVTIGAIGSTLVSATCGLVSLYLGGMIEPGHELETWRAWWVGDAIGDLVVAPLILTWAASTKISRDPRRVLEAAALAATAVLVTLFVFHEIALTDAPFRHPYMAFPVLIWAGIRFDQRGATTVSFLVSVIAIVATTRGDGPFAHETLHLSLLYLQVYVATAAVTALLLGAASAERRAAIRLRDDFLSIASHELRTPLAALVLQVDDLQRLVREQPDSTRVPGKVDRAARATDRLSRLVDGLLDVSRITQSRLELHREPCDLTAIARDLVDRTAEEARRAGCEIAVRADGAVTGSWDPMRMEQVIANLVTNALKYGAGHPIEVSVASTEDKAILTVRDHGIGISPEDLDRIFGRFERAVPIRHYGGLGLGLYITQRIVEAHGGRIRATSEPGAGSLFAVELPRAAA